MKTSEWMARCSNAALQMVREHEAGKALVPEFSRLEPKPEAQTVVTLNKLHQGDWLRSILARGEFCRADSQSPEWLGYGVAEHLGLDISEKNNVSLIKDAIKRWFRHGVIAMEYRPDKTRHMRQFYVPPKALRR